MEAVRLQKLQEYIALPDMRKRIIPTVLFRGHLSPRYMQSMFNFACAMMLAECQDLSEGSKLYSNTEFGHWCGFHKKKMAIGSLRSAFNRFKLCPEVTAIVPTLTEYVDWVWPKTFNLVPVNIVSKDRSNRITAWREYAALPKKPRIFRVVDNKAYPLTTEKPHHCSDDYGNTLLMVVHNIVPKGIPHEIRADLCQDLMVAVLGGDISIENLPNKMEEYIRNARKFMANRWKHQSIDQPLGWNSDMTLKDILAAPEPENDELEMCANHAH